MKYAINGNNDPTSAFNPRTARAYCEGRAAKAGGAAVGTNPFKQDFEAENYTAWIAGHTDQATIPAKDTHCAV